MNESIEKGATEELDWPATLHREFSKGGNFYVYLVLVSLTLVAYLFGRIELTEDYMIPFKSATFILGCGAVFFWSLSYSFAQAMQMAFGVLLIMFFVRWQFEVPTNWTRLAVELPLVAVFLFGLAAIPNLVPWMLETEVARLGSENKKIEEKLERLEHNLGKFQEREVKDKASMERKGLATITSRITSINHYARELQQAGSTREILNLLFHNMAKVLRIQEAIMFILSHEQSEAVIARAMHEQSETLENSRHPFKNEVLAKIIDKKAPIRNKRPTEIVKGFDATYVFPICFGTEVHAIYAIGKAKSSELSDKDLRFLQTMARMSEGAVVQLTIATTMA